jgi:tetratricopeptide (TPR) repeat protein
MNSKWIWRNWAPGVLAVCACAVGFAQDAGSTQHQPAGSGTATLLAGPGQPTPIWATAIQRAREIRDPELERMITDLGAAFENPRVHDNRVLQALELAAKDQVNAGLLGHAAETYMVLGQYLPREAAIWENIAILLLRTHHFALAEEYLRLADSLRRSPRVTFNRGLCLMRLGRFEEAAAMWEGLAQTPAVGEEAAAAKELHAVSLLLAGRAREAMKVSASGMEIPPRPSLAASTVLALLQAGDWTQARIALKDGISRFPDEGLFRDADSYGARILDPSAAEVANSQRLLEDLGHAALAKILADLDRWDRCGEMLRELHTPGPERKVDLQLLQAKMLDHLDRHGRYAEASESVRWYRKAIAQGFPEAMVDLGQCCSLGQGIDRDAREAYVWCRLAALRGLARGQARCADLAKLLDSRELERVEAIARERDRTLPVYPQSN